jgi:hypothetical protein
VLDPGFVTDCPYAPEAILFDEILEIDGQAGRIVARMPTHERLSFTALQRAHPERHPRHVSGAVMVQEGSVVYESEQGAVLAPLGTASAG